MTEVKWMWVSTVAMFVLTVALILSPQAQAITNGNDRQRAEQLVCDAIASDPSFKGMDAVAIGLLRAGLTAEQAAQALALSIQETCPEYTKLAVAWARSHN
jgi:predicted small integral membrane protein